MKTQQKRREKCNKKGYEITNEKPKKHDKNATKKKRGQKKAIKKVRSG